MKATRGRKVLIAVNFIAHSFSTNGMETRNGKEEREKYFCFCFFFLLIGKKEEVNFNFVGKGIKQKYFGIPKEKQE